MNGRIYHVAKQGSDRNPGTAESPFLTIQQAAETAEAGDRIVVHEGEYREWVRPRNGGLGDGCRIVYEAAEGEHVVIKGSERITGWERQEGNVWKVCLPNSMFGEYNPYTKEILGDWLVAPREKPVHTGEVYLNGKAFYEAFSREELLHPVKRSVSVYETWGGREEAVLEPDQTIYQWYCRTEGENTLIFANFQGADPNRELTEINVRRSCFCPETAGINYITVRGFEMAQAATPWAPPTDDQPGLIGPFWSRGWIIENNIIHDAKCSAVSLGKEISTGNGAHSRWHRKPGYQYQMEAVFRGLQIGWGKERIGSHIVRNNRIYDCGQNGIVGHMGCIFSEIQGNEIYRIGVKHEFYGHEIGGIKLHAAVDVQIHENYIHDCTLGTWLDWQAQGVRVSRNVYHGNNRDFFVEVSHGPYLVDNNIFTSPYCFDNAAQGGAYVHNLCCGFHNHYPVLNRSTPYHLPHSTQVLGTAPVYGGDDRWYQNLFTGGREEGRIYGTAGYDGSPVSLEEYIGRFLALGHGDVEQYERVKQPAYVEGNVYLVGAKAFDREENCWVQDREKPADPKEAAVATAEKTACGETVSRESETGTDPGVKLTEEKGVIYLEITLPEEMFGGNGPKTEIVTSRKLGMTRISESCFETPEGTELVLNRDLAGNLRGENPLPGPLEGLRPGRNRAAVWKRPQARE